MRAALLALLAGWTAVLLSCASGPQACIVTDAPFLEALGGREAVQALAVPGARTRGLSLRVSSGPAEQDVMAALEEAAADERCRLVVALSTLAVDVRELAREHPGVLFASYGAVGSSGPENFLLLSSDRSAAFREAGARLGGLMLRERAEGEKPLRVGILAVSPTPTAAREIEAFRGGLAERAPEAEPEYRESRSITDRASALRLVREMLGEGVTHFLLKAYGLTVTCLDEAARAGALSVVEDCGSGCPAGVLFSVETDWGATLRAVFDAMPAQGAAWGATDLAEVGRIEGGELGR